MTIQQVAVPQHHQRRGDHPLSHPTVAQRRQVLIFGAVLLLASVLTALATFSNPPADDSVYRLVRAWSWLEALHGFAALTSLPVLGALSAVLLLGVRCRTFLPVASGTLVAGYGVASLLAVLAGRARPLQFDGSGDDSYPSVGLVVLTVLAGLLPMAAESLTLRAAARHLTAAVLGVLVLLAALVEVHLAERWPLDVTGAVLLGSLLVIPVRVLLEQPDRHPWCRSCLWQRRSEAAREADPAVVIVDPRRAALLHRITVAWVAALVVGYGVLAFTIGMPRSPESGVMGNGLELPLQWGALAVIVVGVLLARRWHLTGALVVGFAAAALGYASSVEYPAWVALAVIVTAWLPASLIWLEWHRRATLRTALAAAVASSVALSGVVGAAALTYSSLWGPTHPRSVTAPLDSDPVEWMWTGGVTSSAAEVRLRTSDAVDSVRVLTDTDADLGDATASAPVRPDGDRVAAVSLTQLAPGTTYYYAAEVDGVLERNRVQSFSTFPEGAASFRFALGSCQLGGSNGKVFEAIRAADPLFLVSMGDWTYGNIAVDEPDRFHDQYDLNLTAPAQAALYAQTPIAYVWGDHDYGGNDADRTSASRRAAMSVYRQMTPHYSLAGPEAPLYQAFTVGRVRFLLTDTRAGRDPAGDPRGGFRSSLGAEQREWLLAQLADADQYGMVVWVNPDPWVAGASTAGDDWGGFAQERQLIADAIARNVVDNLLMVSGDAHMLAYDDGTNTDYSTSRAGGFPLFHAAALDRPGSVKGGPYSDEVIPGGGQFGTVDVRDDGRTVEATVTGWDWRSQELLRHVIRFQSR